MGNLFSPKWDEGRQHMFEIISAIKSANIWGIKQSNK